MRLKTYFDNSVEAAMQAASADLGGEAMLVHSKRTEGEARGLGQYEVVFAIPEATRKPAPTTPAVSPAAYQAAAGDLAGLREAVEQTMRLVRRSEAMLSAQSRLSGEFADLAAALEDAGFSADFRTRVLTQLGDTFSAAPSGDLWSRCAAWLVRQVRSMPQLGRSGAARRCVALIGPGGAGKTLTAVKLASKFGVTARRPAQFLSIESERLGASESLRAYASVLGIGFQAVDSPHSFGQALAEHANKDLVLIDTPALLAGVEAAEELSAYFESRREIEKHLVLAADVCIDCQRRYLERYARLAPDKLLFTRLDEAQSHLGPLFETAIESGLPLSFVATGANAIEDLEPAQVQELAARILPPDWPGETQPAGGERRYATA